MIFDFNFLTFFLGGMLDIDCELLKRFNQPPIFFTSQKQYYAVKRI
jgi:hypothetical protein